MNPDFQLKWAATLLQYLLLNVQVSYLKPTESPDNVPLKLCRIKLESSQNSVHIVAIALGLCLAAVHGVIK